LIIAAIREDKRCGRNEEGGGDEGIFEGDEDTVDR